MDEGCGFTDNEESEGEYGLEVCYWRGKQTRGRKREREKERVVVGERVAKRV